MQRRHRGTFFRWLGDERQQRRERHVRSHVPCRVRWRRRLRFDLRLLDAHAEPPTRHDVLEHFDCEQLKSVDASCCDDVLDDE